MPPKRWKQPADGLARFRRPASYRIRNPTASLHSVRETRLFCVIGAADFHRRARTIRPWRGVFSLPRFPRAFPGGGRPLGAFLLPFFATPNIPAGLRDLAFVCPGPKGEYGGPLGAAVSPP